MNLVEFTNNKDRNRYEVRVDGELAGFAEYIAMAGLIVFSHTEVLPKHEGEGVGSALARFALDDVREEGSRQVQPLCPFIAGWIERHPDYQDLVRR